MWEIQSWCGFVLASPGLVGPSRGSRSISSSPLWRRLPPVLTCWPSHSFPQGRAADQEDPRHRGRAWLSWQCAVSRQYPGPSRGEARSVGPEDLPGFCWFWTTRTHCPLNLLSKRDGCVAFPCDRKKRPLPYVHGHETKGQLWFVNCRTVTVRGCQTHEICHVMREYCYFNLSVLCASFTICVFVLLFKIRGRKMWVKFLNLSYRKCCQSCHTNACLPDRAHRWGLSANMQLFRTQAELDTKSFLPSLQCWGLNPKFWTCQA